MLTALNRHAITAKIIFAPLGAAALIYWASREQSFEIQTNPWLLVIGGLFALCSLIPFALRLRQVLKIIDFGLSSADSLRILTQSMFYYFFVPLSVGTEVSKFAKLQNIDPLYPKGMLASGIVLDHLVGLAVLIVMSLGLYFGIEPFVVQIKQHTALVTAICALLIVIGTLIYLSKSKKLVAEQILKHCVLHQKQLVLALACSLLMHLLIAAAVFCGALHWQIEISYLQVLFVLTGAFLFQMVPINLVGVGAIEIAGAGLYLAVGLTMSQAISLVSLLYCYRILIALVGGLWEFVDGWRAQQRKALAG